MRRATGSQRRGGDPWLAGDERPDKAQPIRYLGQLGFPRIRVHTRCCWRIACCVVTLTMAQASVTQKIVGGSMFVPFAVLFLVPESKRKNKKRHASRFLPFFYHFFSIQTRRSELESIFLVFFYLFSSIFLVSPKASANL